MINGKAVLIREDYCDGLGDCLPACPVNAISFEMREAAGYDEKAVIEAKALRTEPSCSCPGLQSKTLARPTTPTPETSCHCESHLQQWPVQIKLAPTTAPYFHNAHLLITADCTAYAYGNFHHDFIRNRITLIGCPKLDNIDYTDKLTEIIANNHIKSVTIVRMEVPCCGAIEIAAKRAIQASGKFLPWQVVTITTDGHIKE